MSNQPPNTKPSRPYLWILILICLIVCIPLIGFIWTGLYARYLQDDYCYAAMLRGDNFWIMQWRSYTEFASYSANRYSLTLLMAISEAMGRFTVALLPGIAVVLWTGGFFYLIRQISRLLHLRLLWLECFLLSAALVYLSLYLAPNRVQILYWRAAMFPYLAPLIAQTFLAGWIIQLGRQGKTRALAGIGLALLAFLSAGFSETGAAYQVGMLGMGLAAVILAKLQKHPLGQSFFLPILIALLFSLLGMVALIVSPVNAMRMGRIYPEAQSVLGVLTITTNSLINYLQHLLYRVTLPTFFTFILFACFGWIYFTRYTQPLNLSWRRLALLLVGIQVVHLILIFCDMAPSAYAESSAPGMRALLSARVTSVITTALSGFLVGTWASARSKQRLLRWITIPLVTAGVVTASVLLFLATATTTLEPAYPDMRTYLLAHPFAFGLILFSGLAAGVLVAWWTDKSISTRIRLGAYLPAIVLLLAALTHLTFATVSIYAQIPSFRLRAQLWDMRDAQIRQMAAEGKREIEVRALDSLAEISELHETPDFWINNCAEMYYGVDALWAVEPILNPPSAVKP